MREVWCGSGMTPAALRGCRQRPQSRAGETDTYAMIQAAGRFRPKTAALPGKPLGFQPVPRGTLQAEARTPTCKSAPARAGGALRL